MRKSVSFFNEVTLTTRPGASIDNCIKEAMTMLRAYSYEKVMFKFNGVMINVDHESTVSHIAAQYFKGTKND